MIAVLRRFYEFHLVAGRGPLVNPVPAAARNGGRERTAIRYCRLGLPRFDGQG
jgi:hypothetical protein